MQLSDSARGCYEEKIIELVRRERDRQQRKWGIQTHPIAMWMTILGEEYGEACKAGLETEFNGHTIIDLKKELVQVMAVALAIIEGIEVSQ